MVAHPRDEAELEAVLEWCAGNGYCTIPYGGGSSVVGGVTPPADAGPVVTIALDQLDRVLEIDEVSRAARIQAGVFGPALEDQLRPSGYTLRHFPQSFTGSTLGGWVATRSGGHYATNHTHIDEFVETVRMLTPQGWWEARRLPGSGAGPDPNRLAIGSEGILGIITEALDAHPGPAGVPGHRQRPLPLVGSRLRGRPPGRPGQAVAGQPAPPRPGAGGRKRRPRRPPVGAHRVVRIGRTVAAGPARAGARPGPLLWRHRSRR